MPACAQRKSVISRFEEASPCAQPIIARLNILVATATGAEACRLRCTLHGIFASLWKAWLTTCRSCSALRVNRAPLRRCPCPRPNATPRHPYDRHPRERWYSPLPSTPLPSTPSHPRRPPALRSCCCCLQVFRFHNRHRNPPRRNHPRHNCPHRNRRCRIYRCHNCRCCRHRKHNHPRRSHSPGLPSHVHQHLLLLARASL
mmetsp:Transcript_6082/g.13392  ORF Transcript_6082/g.13392 Transcript_6082/m.13392 type:complete len:201 (+) Transcript_6082:165-767(+)